MLFKHSEEKVEPKVVSAAPVPASVVPEPPVQPEKDVSPAALRELLEKNLKWSQIIYEQNRKINSKLFWSAFADWMRLLILFGTFAAAAWLLPPLIGNMMRQYNSILGDITGAPTSALNKTSDDLCKLLPANLQESCKTITNNQKK